MRTSTALSIVPSSIRCPAPFRVSYATRAAASVAATCGRVQRPHRQSCCRRVAEGAAYNRRGDPLSREQSNDDPQGQREMVDVVSGEGEWSDQETGDDKEARDEQGFPKELQLDPCRIVLVRAVDRQSRQERADNPREVYEIGDRACHRHDAQHQQEMGLLVTPHLALNAQAPARLSPIRINGTKTAISMSWMASPTGEKPVVYIDTQTANTISESVSERTVAPIVTLLRH